MNINVVLVQCIGCYWIFFLFFTINVGIGIYFTHYKYMSRNKENVPKYDRTSETTI